MTKNLCVIAKPLAVCLGVMAFLGTFATESQAYQGRKWTYEINGYTGTFTRSSTVFYEDSANGERYTFKVVSEDDSTMTLYDANRDLHVRFIFDRAYGTLPGGDQNQYQFLYRIKKER